jgi:hypothetical protein
LQFGSLFDTKFTKVLDWDEERVNHLDIVIWNPSGFDGVPTVSLTYRAVVLTSASAFTDAAAFSISATTAPG